MLKALDLVVKYPVEFRAPSIVSLIFVIIPSEPINNSLTESVLCATTSANLSKSISKEQVSSGIALLASVVEIPICESNVNLPSFTFAPLAMLLIDE